MHNLNFMKFIGLTFITFLIGYIENFAGTYIQVLNPKTIEVKGDINKYREKCKHEAEDKVCTDLYRLDLTGNKFEYIGLGYILSSLKIYCDTRPDHKINIEDPKNPGRIFDLVNTYNIVNVNALGCKRNLIIEAWSPSVTRRTGFQKGQLVFGDYESVLKVKKISEIASRSIYTFIFIILLIILTLRVYFKISIHDTDFLIFYEAIPILLFKLFFAVNLYSYFIPLSFPSNFINKTVFIFSTLVHTSIVLSCFFKEQGKKYNLFIFTILLINTLLIDKWHNLFYFIYPTLILLLSYISFKRSSLLFTYYTIFVVTSFLKVSGLHIMPNGRITSVSLFFIISFFLIKLSKSHIFRLKKIISKLNKDNKNLVQYITELDKLKSEYKSLIHDLRSPLTVLEASDDHELIKASTKRINDLVNTKLNVINGKSDFLKSIKNLIKEKEVLLKFEFSNIEEIETSKFIEVQVTRVLSNIIDNSIEANSDNEMSVTLDFNNKKEIEIVIDNQTEIPDDILKKLNSGESFTTKEYGNGIGASTSFKIITDLNGEIVYHSDGKVKILIPTG